MTKTLVVTVVTLAVVACGGFAVQALALGRPARGTLELVHVLTRLDAYKRSRAVIVVDGTSHSTSCEQHWLRNGRDTAVVVDGRTMLREVGHRLVGRGALASVQFDLAACPRSLATWLASQLLRRASAVSARVDGQRVVELRLPDARPALDVFVAARTDLPVGLVVAGPRVHGASDVEFGPAT